MEEISETAKAYYANLSEKQKRLAANLFQAIDANGDGKISFDEYAKYMKQKGFKTISSPDFFRKLDKDGNGTLDFNEFVALHYICLSERVFVCDECRVFLDGVYFTCVQCFNGPGTTYDLCCGCYGDKNINHHKDALFLDNYTLLQAKRQQNKRQGKNGGVSETVEVAVAGLETSSNIISLCNPESNNPCCIRTV